jgi:hypothetical protein
LEDIAELFDDPVEHAKMSSPLLRRSKPSNQGGDCASFVKMKNRKVSNFYREILRGNLITDVEKEVEVPRSRLTRRVTQSKEFYQQKPIYSI